jgi:hypothetical protein
MPYYLAIMVCIASPHDCAWQRTTMQFTHATECLREGLRAAELWNKERNDHDWLATGITCSDKPLPQPGQKMSG